ncbi:MFS general substrate transporter [Crassisporium funariophilum]|nr:MFS general substrate transporter [Crassisporium funariophilum]
MHNIDHGPEVNENLHGDLAEHQAGHNEATPLIQPQVVQRPWSKKQQATARIQYLVLCCSIFLIGWNDGSPGPLLPRLQKVYNLDYAAVSLIFVFSCVGVVFGALVNMPLNERFGFGKMLVFGSLLQVAAFGMQSLALPFPHFVASFFIGGAGMAILDAHANGFVAAMHSETKMGFMHAAYGVGALIAPLCATQFAALPHWSFHYLVSLMLALSNTLLLVFVFKFARQDECLRQAGQLVTSKGEVDNDDTKFMELFRTKSVHLLALFLAVYVGIEVTIGAWIVTFMMVVRGGGPSSGYIASGFYGGLTLGRVILLWVNKQIGEARAVYVYTLFAILFQLVVWLVPSIVGGAITVCMIGILLGPMYPIVMNHTSRILPRSLVTASIGWVSACGAAGSALLPLLTGRLATKYGIASLQPFLVGMMMLMAVLWYMVPKKPQRSG